MGPLLMSNSKLWLRMNPLLPSLSLSLLFLLSLSPCVCGREKRRRRIFLPFPPPPPFPRIPLHAFSRARVHTRSHVECRVMASTNGARRANADMMQMTRGLRLDAHRAEWCLKEEEEKISRTRRRRSVEARAYGPRSLLVTSLLSSIIITMIITLSLPPPCVRSCAHVIASKL